MRENEEWTHGAAKGDVPLGKGGSELAASKVGLLPRVADRAMYYGFPGRVHQRRPLQKPEWRQGRVVRRVLGKIINVSLYSTHFFRLCYTKMSTNLEGLTKNTSR